MIYIADANGKTDSAYHTLVSKILTDKDIVMVSWVDGFRFNESLLGLENYVLICYCEYGWNFEIKDSHIWGVNKDTSGRYVGGDWDRFDEWVKSNPPKLILKRELLKKDVSDRVKPIDYPCGLEVWSMQLKPDFDSRPINVFQYWGRSNECRIRIQGEVWNHAFKKGFQPCDNVYYINQYLSEERGEKWITLWIPHWARIPIEQLMEVNGLSKLSLSWPGAGFKCFRTSEAPVNSVMVMHKNEFAYAYDWNETNCILVEPGKEIEGIEAALSNPNLYEIYLLGMRNADRYRTPNYINNYLLPLINNA